MSSPIRTRSRVSVCLFVAVAALVALGATAAAAGASSPDPSASPTFTAPGLEPALVEGDGSAHITGRVVDEAGSPLPGVYAIAFSFDPWYGWQWAGSTVIGEDGSYDVAVPAGTFRVRFSDYSGAHAEEYWDNAGTLASARDIVVGAGETVAGIDAVLSDWAHIRGTVSDRAGHPLEGVGVTAYQWGDYSGTWQQSSSAVLTDDQGRYDIGGVYEGTYRVDFTDPQGRPYAQEAWDDADTIDVATDIVVPHGTVVDGVDAVLDEGAHVAGRVTGPGGAPLEGIQVIAIREGPGTRYDRSTFTDADGRYDIGGLAGATHVVGFIDPSYTYLNEYFENAADEWSGTPVLTPRGSTTTVDAELEQRGMISGAVTHTDGSPFELGGTVIVFAVYSWETYSTSISPDGTYSLGPLPNGVYRVYFDPARPYAAEWWDDWHGDIWGATWIDMWSGRSVSGIDAKVTGPSNVSGKVADSAGNPVAGVSVAAYRTDDGWSWNWASDASTDAAGHYRLGGLQQGTVRVFFGGTAALFGEWWNDKDSLESADDIAVPVETDVTGIDAVLGAPSSVSGTVKDKAGQPLAGIGVAAWQQDDDGWQYVSDASTDATGHYRIDGLRRGLARVHFLGTSALLGEWWDDQLSLASATDIPIPEEAEVGGIDAILAGASSVSGAVSAQDLGPVGNVKVQAWQRDGSGWAHVRDASTDATGSYRLGGLRSGVVRVRFVGTADLVGEWWDDKASLSSATNIVVAEEMDVTGIDAVLRAYARLSGRVTDAAGAQLNASVELYRWNGMWMDYVGSRWTDWNGRYSFAGLKPGDYAVGFWSWGYLAEYYDDAWPQDAATMVTLASGQSVSAIDAALSVGSSLRGTARTSDGTPISGVTVRAYRYERRGDWWDETEPARTAADGSYSLDLLRDGTYLVQFSGAGEYFGEWYDNARTREQAADVTVPKDAVVEGIDATLETGARIAGTVTTKSHKPLEGIGVIAFQRDGHGNWRSAGRAASDAAGGYALAGLAEGTCRVRFSDPDRQYLDEYWDDAAVIASADDVNVHWGETTSGIDAVLIRSSHISGHVRRIDGSGVNTAAVAAYASDGDGGWAYLARVTTDATGRYDLPGLAAGSYRVQFTDLTKKLAPEWWDDAADVAAADNVSLDWQETRDGIDAVLQPAGSISGTVTATGDGGLKAVNVVAYGRDANGGWRYTDQVTTDALGKYAIQGVGTGSYRLRAVDVWPYWWDSADRGEYLDEWYDDAYSLASATDVPVTAGAETRGIDIELGRAGHVSGTVTNAGGEGVHNVYVQAYRNDGQRWRYLSYATTDATGAYDVGQLPGGEYRVEFSPWRSHYAGEWYEDARTADEATPVTVVPGETTAGIDAVLELSSRLEGTVTGPDGSPLPGVGVYLARYADGGGWEYSLDSSTDATGKWVANDVRPGSWRVWYVDFSGVCADEFWDDQLTPQDATLVQVGAGEVFGNLDAQLSPAASISGRVTGPDGRRIEYADVYLWALGPSGWHKVTPGDPGFTNHFGEFGFGRLHEGVYRISIDARQQGYAPRFWPSSPDLAGATDIVVEPGQDVTGIDLELGAGEAIAGHVTDAGGRGARVAVTAYKADGAGWEVVADASTDATGAYRLPDLAPGTYRLRFGDDRDWVSWFFTRWAYDAASLEDASDVVVRDGSGTVSVDATLLHRAQPVDLASASHPDQAAWYRTRDLSLAWTAAEPAIVDGYSWLLDRSSATVAPKWVTGRDTSAGYAGLADGTWYFHVRGLGVQEAQPGVWRSSWSPTVQYVVHVDTVPPVTEAPSQATVKRDMVTIEYRVTDPQPNGGTATVRIEIRSNKGKKGQLAQTVTLGVQPVNKLLRATFRCTLADGTYTFSVLATDTAGNQQSSIGKNKLQVH